MKTGGEQRDGSLTRPRLRGLVPLLDPELPILTEDVLLHRSRSLDPVKPKPPKQSIPHTLSLPSKTNKYQEVSARPSHLSETSDVGLILPLSRNTLFRPPVEYTTLQYEAAIIAGKKQREPPKDKNEDKDKDEPNSRRKPTEPRPAAKHPQHHSRNRSRSAVNLSISPLAVHCKPKTPPQTTAGVPPPLRPYRPSRHPVPSRPAIINQFHAPSSDPLKARLTCETTLPDGTIFSRPLNYRLHPDRTIDTTGYPFAPKLRDGDFALPDDSGTRVGRKPGCRWRIERMGVGIEAEFLAAEKRGRSSGDSEVGKGKGRNNVNAFGARMAAGHNDALIGGGGVRMANYMALQQVYMDGKGRALPEQKGLDEWSLVYDATVSTAEEPWGLELRSPLFIAYPNPLPSTPGPTPTTKQVPSYHTHVLRTWSHLKSHYHITTANTCATHVHISLPGGFNMSELRAIAQCAIYFEPAFDALVPPHRATSKFAKSSWLNRNVQKPDAAVGVLDTSPLPLVGNSPGRVVRWRAPPPPTGPVAGAAWATGSGSTSASASATTASRGAGGAESGDGGVNLSLLSRLDAIRALSNMHTYADLVAAVNPWERNYAWSFRSMKRLYTVEFREPPASSTAEEALGWAELAAGFVRAAVLFMVDGELEGKGGLFEMLPTVGGLKAFVEKWGGDWGGGKYLDRVWESKNENIFIEAVHSDLLMEDVWDAMKERREEDRSRIQGMLKVEARKKGR